MNHLIGTKVIPHSKTIKYMKGFAQCEYWADAKRVNQGFLYIVDYDRNDYVLNNNPPKGYDFDQSYSWNTEKKVIVNGDSETIIKGYSGIGNLYSESDFTVAN
ncbi:hypothetical protein [Paenibacillus sp. QZ-Y1]|uniref:hypothetical protein n=1 Tax=Paenibacillus sp. QZ-Y1 TaxID=3414511 RepID=UPI003F7A94B7